MSSLYSRKSGQHRECFDTDNKHAVIAEIEDSKHRQRLYSRCRNIKRSTILIAMAVNFAILSAVYFICHRMDTVMQYKRIMLWQLNEWTAKPDEWWLTPEESLPKCTRFESLNYSLSIDSALINWSDLNLVYIKAEKVGGSTVSGVVRGIAHKFKLNGPFSREWISKEPSSVKLTCSVTSKCF